MEKIEQEKLGWSRRINAKYPGGSAAVYEVAGAVQELAEKINEIIDKMNSWENPPEQLKEGKVIPV